MTNRVSRERNRQRPYRLILALGIAALASLLLALTIGSMTVSPSALLSLVSASSESIDVTIIKDLRLPRALSAFAVGGLLALAGVLIQVLLRNPLGDPYVLGVSGGAATGALLALLLGLGTVWLHTAAFAGALGSMLLVFLLARSRGPWTPTRLLLTGVILAAGWAALISFILVLTPARQLPGMLFWLMGDLSDARNPLPVVFTLGLGLAAAWLIARPLNLLQRGEAQAQALGVTTGPLTIGVYLLSSLLTATAVTAAGSVGFVGLVVPHMFRLLGGSDHRLLLPGSVLLGGTLLLLADTLARTIIAPQQLPVGIITALLGIPIFLLLLLRTDKYLT